MATEVLARAASQVRWFGGQVWQQFFGHDCMSAAGALTYTTLFAVVPIMTVAYAMFSLVPEFAEVGERVEAFVFDNFVPDSSALVHDKLSEFSQRARSLTFVGFGFLFGTAFMLLITIEGAFNTIWNVAEPRRGLQRLLLYWAVLSLTPPLIGGGFLISVYLMSTVLIPGLDAFGLGSVLLGYLPLVLTTAAFTVLYYAVPNCRVPFKHALMGGMLTMLLFEAAQRLFTLVVTNSSIEPIYGTFAAVPLFLTWLYIVWVLILSGAIFVRTLSLRREFDDDSPEPLIVKCARILALLHDAHMQGRAVADDEVQQHVPLSRAEHERIYAVLAELNVLSHTEDERWSLGRNLASMTLWDLYERLPDGLNLERLTNVEDLEGVVQPLRAMIEFGSNEMAVRLDYALRGSALRADVAGVPGGTMGGAC